MGGFKSLGVVAALFTGSVARNLERKVKENPTVSDRSEG
jgi:hypothetical protein